MRAWPVSCHRLWLKRLACVNFSVQCHRQFALRKQFPRVTDLIGPEAAQFRDSYLTLNGFIQSIRKQKRVGFATIGDGSCMSSIQAVMTPKLAEPLANGTAVSIKGRWVESQGRGQSYELHAHEVEVLGDNDAMVCYHPDSLSMNYVEAEPFAKNHPIQKKYQSPEFLRTIPHLRTKIPFYALMLRLRSQLISDTTSFFVEQGFIQAHTPIITSSDCEGAGEVFTVHVQESKGSRDTFNDSKHQHSLPYFRSPKYLTVSSQLHLEALAQSVGKVWTLSPAFRAEQSDTSRHLSEFYMIEAEIAFTTHLNDIMDVIENLIRELTRKLSASQVGKELLLLRSRPEDGTEDNIVDDTCPSNLDQRWAKLIGPSWPRIRYEDAIAFLQKAASTDKAFFETRPCFETGLQTEHEKYIAEQIGLGGPVFITDYPQVLKPFYMSLSSEQPRSENSSPTVACFDLVLPDICELAGGSLREDRFEKLQDFMRLKGISATSGQKEDEIGPLDWYLDLRRFGSVCHGGFGLGFDRLLAYLSGISNVRDVVTFPRHYGKCLC